MTITAVLPFRSIDSAKSRMAPLLSEEERREFSARLLERTLLALGREAIHQQREVDFLREASSSEFEA